MARHAIPVEQIEQFGAGFLEGGEDVMRSTFGPTYARLVALEDACEPTNLFRLDQNTTTSESAQADGGERHG